MATKGSVLDYSGWRPTDNDYLQMRALGIEGLVRYPNLGPGTDWKACNKSEYDRILSFGFTIAFTPELKNDTWLGGRKAGLEIGKKARDWVHSLGFPDSRPQHFAVDTNVAPAQLGVALDFLGGCRDGGGPASCYGETSIVDAAFDQGITVNGWRAAATSWDIEPSKHASIFQLVQKSYPLSGAYDENLVLRPDWGQHPAPTGDPMPQAPYSLCKDENGVVWQIDAGQTNKIRMPDQAVIDWVRFLLLTAGFTAEQATVGDVGSNAMLRRWLANIPDGNYKPVSPPPPPAVVDNAAIAKVVLDAMSGRLSS